MRQDHSFVLILQTNVYLFNAL